MGMDSGSSDGAKADINVTPLVDVCLVLLIIFMVMVPKNVPEISVRVPPESKQKIKKQDSDTLVIGLSKEGGVSLNHNAIDKGALGDKIEALLRNRDKKVVFVDFDDEAKYGDAIEVLDIAKRSGAAVLGIMKKRNEAVPETLTGL
jgi:biopolymer transport protein ExbD